MTDPRAALRPLIAALRTPAARRAFAAQLRALADEQEALADADERSGHVLRRARIETQAAAQRTGRPRGSGGAFVRYEAGHGGSGRLHIGRTLWQLIGEPRRVDVQRLGGRLEVRPCADGAGWSVTRPPNGMPRISIGQEAAETLRLEARRYPAHITGGAIITED